MRKYRKKSRSAFKRTSYFKIITLVLLILSIVCAIILLFKREDAVPVLMQHPNLDTRATEIERKWYDFGFEKKSDADTFSYEIKRSITFESWDEETEINLANPAKNQYLMVLELALNDTQEVIFRSGYIQPNTEISKVALDFELAKGEYDVTAYISVISPNNEDFLGVLEQPINVRIKS